MTPLKPNRVARENSFELKITLYRVRCDCSLTVIYLPGTSFEHEHEHERERDRANAPFERVKEIRLATCSSYPAESLARGSENPRETSVQLERAQTTQTEETTLRGLDRDVYGEGGCEKTESFTRFCARYMPSSITP